MDFETPQEREQRLAEMKIENELRTVLQREHKRALREQSQEVRRLSGFQTWTNDALDAAVMFEIMLQDDNLLPATVEALEAATASLRRLSGEAAVEVAGRWEG